MLFSLLKHYLDTDTALKVSQTVYCFTSSISHGVENYFPRLWGKGISDAIFNILTFPSKLSIKFLIKFMNHFNLNFIFLLKFMLHLFRCLDKR